MAQPILIPAAAAHDLAELLRSRINRLELALDRLAPNQRQRRRFAERELETLRPVLAACEASIDAQLQAIVDRIG